MVFRIPANDAQQQRKELCSHDPAVSVSSSIHSVDELKLMITRNGAIIVIGICDCWDKVTVTVNMPIFLTEHMTEHMTERNMTEHSLDVTICKNYTEPQDEVVESPQKDSSTCKMREEPQDEVPMTLLHKLADLIKKRDWDQLSTDLSLRGAHEELREYKGLLLHLALRFDAPLSLNSLTTRTLV